MTFSIPPISLDRARFLADAMTRVRVLVVGDVTLDQWVIGRVTRVAREAPVPVVIHERDEYRAGSAAGVAIQARALGAAVDLVGVVGADDAAARLRDLLHSADVAANALITDDKRRTITRMRIVTPRSQQVARVDYESEDPASQAVEDAVADQVTARMPDVGAVIVTADLNGLVTRRVMAAIVAAAQEHARPVIVDPKSLHLDFSTGAAFVTPDQHEVEAATNLRIRTDEDAERAATLFRARARCDAVLIAGSDAGMWLSCEGSRGGRLPTPAHALADRTDPRDIVIAMLAVALAAGASPTEAALLAARRPSTASVESVESVDESHPRNH